MSLAKQIKEYLPCPIYMFATVDSNKQWKKYLVKYGDLDKFLPDKTLSLKKEYHFKPMLSRKSEGYFVFIDDLSEEKIMKMKLDGIIPCLEVETSPNNYQVWIRFRDKMDKETLKATSRYLTKKYEGDNGAIASSHFGRVPCFPRITKDGKRFVTRLVGGSTIINRNLDIELPHQEVVYSRSYINNIPRNINISVQDKANQYINLLLSKGYKDMSVVDFIASIWLLRDGFYKEEVVGAMMKVSPDIKKRKHGESHAQRYLSYTVEKASTRVDERRMTM